MPVYIYSGVKGKAPVKGKVKAPSEDVLRSRLEEQGVSIESISQASAFQLEIKLPTIGTGVKKKEVAVFTRQFSTMIDAGLPLVQCLDIQVKQLTNLAFKKIVGRIKESVESGSSFADALGKHPKLFDRLFVNMVAAGETGGVLDVVMNKLATYIEKAEALKGKVKGAMIYPVIIILVSIGILALLLIVVVPTFAEMFASFDKGLPAITQFLVNLSNAAVKFGPFVAIFLVIFIIVFIQSKKRIPAFTYFLDGLMLKLPIFGPLVQKQAIAKFTSTLGTLVSAGVPIIDSLEITAKTSGNTVIEKAIVETRQAIQEGKTIAEPLKKANVFPAMVVQMIDVGEQSGALDKMLTKVAEFYEAEVDEAVNNLTAMMEPIIMVFLGGIIGFFVIAMYLPIFQMSTAVM